MKAQGLFILIHILIYFFTCLLTDSPEAIGFVGHLAQPVTSLLTIAGRGFSLLATPLFGSGRDL